MTNEYRRLSVIENDPLTVSNNSTDSLVIGMAAADAIRLAAERNTKVILIAGGKTIQVHPNTSKEDLWTQI